MSLTVKSEGRRHYIEGNTFAIRDQLRSAGCKWDPDRKAWWTGKREIADRFTATETSAEPKQPAAEDAASIKIVAKAKYKGRVYYVRYVGQTKRGYAARLVSLDGKIDFWAAAAEPGDRSHDGSGDVALVIKTYQPREWNGRYEHMTLASLQRFVADAKQARDTGECPKCRAMMDAGKWAPYYGSGDYDDCPVCGCTVQITY
jgi:hypothetical protein